MVIEKETINTSGFLVGDDIKLMISDNAKYVIIGKKNEEGIYSKNQLAIISIDGKHIFDSLLRNKIAEELFIHDVCYTKKEALKKIAKGMLLLRKDYFKITSEIEENERKRGNDKNEAVIVDGFWAMGDNGKRKLIHNELAKKILEDYNIISVGNDKPELYFFNGKYYECGGGSFIGKKCQELTEGCLKNFDVNEVVGQIERMTNVGREIFSTVPNNIICVENGVLDIDNLNLKEHSPDYYFTSGLNHTYDPNAECKKVMAFLEEVLDENDVILIQELLGFCLYREYFIKKAFIFWGVGDTGKTTLIKLIIHFIGELNKSGVSLHKILYDKFAAYGLYGKHLNVYDDLSFKDIKETGSFKIATGGGYLPVEKKFGEGFDILTFAKLLFATNKFSAVVDADDMAYYGRWVIVPFEKVFDNENPKTDRNILKELTTDKEMSGLLNWALDGLKRLLEKGNFSYTLSAEENKMIMEKNSSTIVAYIHDCLKEQQDGWIATQDLYSSYCDYTNDKGLSKTETLDKFSKDLTKRLTFAIAKQKDVIYEGKKKLNVRCWLHITNTYNTFLKSYIDKNKEINKNNKNNNNYNNIDVQKDVIDVSKTEDIEDEPVVLDSKAVKDTLISLFTTTPEIEVQQFLSIYPEKFHAAIDIMLDNLKRDGEIMESRAGFVKLL